MASETYLDNKVRRNTRVKFYSALLCMKINTFQEVQDRFFRPPNNVAILVSILERLIS